MSELITQQIFSDGQQNINAADMNGIIGKATVQPDIIAAKPASATMDVADQFLVLKTDNTLARGRFDTITNSVASTLPLADTTKNGALRQLSGNASDYVGGDNQCHPLVPTGTVWDTLASVAPAGWLILDGSLVSRSTYSNLFALIGTVYGAGDGSTTFALPDARGRTTIGAGTGSGLTNRVLGTYVGTETVSLVTANLPAHTHTITDPGHAHTIPAHGHTASDSGHTHAMSGNATTIGVNAQAPVSQIAYFATTNTGVGFAQITVANAPAFTTVSNTTGITGTGSVGSGTAVANMQPSLVVNKMVKF
jgi:microcystin-dependent protein